ncbi:hypothetical protein SDC9_54448 [bioreactor metagenome]|uniref:Bacterial repeat domain-containing protein n=1 Tax=bioreactor metagenome TaxID=1076179 RepID=A0A644WW32_9ZZZZ
MKTYKYRLLSVIMMLVLVVSIGTPALAVVSQYDEQYLTVDQKQDIQDATDAWWDAYNSGDQEGMDAAHAAAEDVRATEDYSGGADGSEYIYTGGSSSNDDYYYYYTPTYYTVTATSGTGGSISPSGSASVTSGSSQTYTITANSGYMISSVTIDGTSVGAISSYTFSNVTSAHSISVTFASAASLSAGTGTLGDGGSGTLTTGNVTKSGYGITVSLPVTSSYVSGTTVTAGYNFTSAKTVTLEYVNGTWQFPVNSCSATGARKIYIPVETKDSTYTITFTVKALDPQATALSGSNVYLTDTKSVTLTVKGSMYEDDFTGDS